MKQQEFINLIKQDALKLQKETGIPAAVKIAQAALETGWGRWMPVDMATGAKSFNLFGIKHHGNEKTPYVTCLTHEFVGGVKKQVTAKFRKYGSFFESLKDHSQFLLKNPRYKPAFQYKNDPIRFAQELQKAGYATDPEYANKLISIMRKYNLLDLR